MKYDRNRRLLCGLCALLFALVSVFPAAAFAEEPAAQSLTASEAKAMQQADDAVTALTDSEEFAAMDTAQRADAAEEQLQALVAQGLVQKGSVYWDEENGMVSFAYSCGALGGILVTDLDEENDAADLQLAETQAAENIARGSAGKAVIYYAFDNTVNSSRYPNYAYMKSYWDSVGLDTRLNTSVTVSDLRRMGDYDLCVLSTHGAYYTYEYGLFRKQTKTEPILLLMEQSDFWQDLRYGMDLLKHNIIKVNGMYAVDAGFFRDTYRRGKLRDTIILSETCEFYGKNGHVDTSIADALLNGGAEAVVGYLNNVYSVYSRSMLWAMVNRMLGGDTVQQAMEFALDRYGENDIVWYTAQGGRRPHAAASYPVLSGDTEARLKAVQAAQTTQTVQQAA